MGSISLAVSKTTLSFPLECVPFPTEGTDRVFVGLVFGSLNKLTTLTSTRTVALPTVSILASHQTFLQGDIVWATSVCRERVVPRA